MLEADKEKELNEDVGCNKDYNECPTITGGILPVCTTLTRTHSIPSRRDF